MIKDEPDVFLLIDENLSMAKGDLLGAFGPFWSGIYNKYRGGGGSI